MNHHSLQSRLFWAVNNQLCITPCNFVRDLPLENSPSSIDRQVKSTQLMLLLALIGFDFFLCATSIFAVLRRTETYYGRRLSVKYSQGL